MCVDATDPMKGNWLRYVNWAHSSEEQNLFPLEINKAIYYKVLRVGQTHFSQPCSDVRVTSVDSLLEDSLQINRLKKKKNLTFENKIPCMLHTLSKHLVFLCQLAIELPEIR